MPLGLDIILIILVLGLVGFIIYQNKDFKREMIQNDIQIEKLREENKELIRSSENAWLLKETAMRDAHERIQAADEKVSLLQNELIQLQSSIQVEAVKNDSKESLEAELENLKALAAQKLLELQQITANTQKMAESQNEKLEEIAKLEAGIKALEGRICSGKVILENLESEILTTNNQLQQLANLKASVLAVEEGTGVSWVFGSGDKSRLVELIHQLVDEYGNQFPILRKELLKAEWSSV